MQSIREEHLEMDDAEEEIQALVEENEDLRDKIARQRKRQSAEPATPDEQTVADVAQVFAVMHHYNVQNPIELMKTVVPDDYSEAERFENQESEMHGLARELDSLLPEELRRLRVQDATRLGPVVSTFGTIDLLRITHRDARADSSPTQRVN